jgi:hypothetical protein
MLRIDADRFRDELFKRGRSQRDAAHGSGVSEFTISRAVNGAAVRPSTMRALAGWLAKTPEIPSIALITQNDDAVAAATRTRAAAAHAMEASASGQIAATA